MDFSIYQKEARKTAIYPLIGSNIEYPTLGLAGEAGEICNKVKKIQRDYNGMISAEMRENLLHELGDSLWYIASIASELNLNLDVIALKNIEKLNKRKEENKLQGSGDHR